MEKATEIQVRTLNLLYVESLYEASLGEVKDKDIIGLFDFIEREV
jgi:hypothetical protein